jgi:hypothetical protein
MLLLQKRKFSNWLFKNFLNMNTLTFDLITEKLKNAPQDVLERVVGYVDALIEPARKPYFLSAEQQNILDSQIHCDKSNYVDADVLFDELKSKYEL